MQQYIKPILAIACLVAHSILPVDAQKKSKKDVSAPVQPSTFTFMAFGDMPYHLPNDSIRYQNVIEAINQAAPAFTIHVGDIKASAVRCSNEYYAKTLASFGQFNNPLIYTPGDNEWTDCHREEAGKYDPVERLAEIRKTFFKEPKSFGKQTLPLNSQSAIPYFSKFVENYRWEYGNITFATIHIVGSNNNYLPDFKYFNKEYYERDSADIFWLGETFKQAIQNNSLGIVIAIHADMFGTKDGDAGFIRFIAALKKAVLQYQKPVLLVNGDSHAYLVDKPLEMDKKNKKVVPNFTRLQVFGDLDMHAARIVVNSANPELFEIHQFLVPKN